MDELIKKVLEFRDARDWQQFHNPKDLAISLSLEAAEVLENFQWKDNDEAIHEKSEELQDEIADVLTYVILLSHALDIDLEEAVLNKLAKNELKYPVEQARGSKKKYTDL